MYSIFYDKPTVLKNTIKYRPYRSRQVKLYLTSVLCTGIRELKN